jgi:outer membrane biosynthesis protein TonB
VRWDVSLIVSFAAHGLILLALLHHSRLAFVMPSDVALGTPGSSGSVIYLAPTGAERAETAPEKLSLSLRASAPKPPKIAKPLPVVHENDNATASAQLTETARGGSLYGARIPGAPLTGHEIIPALPQVFPDPAISRADLPPGVAGDVIVEVTIDDHGNVIETRLIRGIGYGIEDRVLATLHQWHFRPASKDGVTIASQHIVTFHYPS